MLKCLRGQTCLLLLVVVSHQSFPTEMVSDINAMLQIRKYMCVSTCNITITHSPILYNVDREIFVL